MSSALIPLLYADLPFSEFVDCNMQLFCRNLWNSHQLIRISVVHIDAALIFIPSVFLFSFSLYIVVVQLFVEFSKDKGDSCP